MLRFMLAFMPLAAALGIGGICTSQRASTCVVSTNRTFSSKKVVRLSGSIKHLQFRGAWWQCTPRLSSVENIVIEIYVQGTLSLLEGSLLHCPTVVIQAKNVVISDTSEISTNGTSHMLDTGSLGLALPQRGASHGGLGGTAGGSCVDDAQLAKRLTSSPQHGDPFAPWEFGRAGGTAGKRGAGGGRIRIQVESEIRLNGTLSAAGVAPDESDDDENAACGSGGSIWISSTSIVQPVSNPQPTTADTSDSKGEVDFVDGIGPASTLQKGWILAPGGCCRKCMCGGGGRILTEVSSGTVPRNVIIAGGCFREVLKMDGEGCRCGSAGTWAFSKCQGRRRRLVPSPVRLPLFKRFRRSQRPVPQPSSCAVATLRVDNSYAVNLAGAKLPQPTSLPAFTSPLSLQVNDALVVPADQDATWLLSGLAMLSDQTGSTLKHLGPGPLVLNFSKTNDGLELAFSSILQARELQILGARHITLRQNAAIDANVANLEADEIHAHQGALGQGEGVFKMKANKVVLGSGRLRAGSIIAEEDLVIKRGSRLQSSQRRCDQLPVRLEGPCDSFLSSADFANRTWLENVSFDILLASRNGGIVVEEEAEIYAGAFLLCSKKNVTVHGLISARGLGCAPNRGDAPGTAPQVQPDGRRSDLSCGGGGGAHCGNGGDGVQNKSHKACLHTGGLKYDGWWQSPSGNQPSRVPTWSASGGGGDTAGAGGGIIWIQSEVLEMPSNSTSISASGEDAVGRGDGGDGSGGGAGGTVIINATKVNGSAAIEAAGGKGGGCIGGGGGGGAIGSAGPNASQVWADYTGSLLVHGGGGDSSLACRGLHVERGCVGELLQLGVCPAGHAGVFCAECPAGTYNPPNEKDPQNLTAMFRMCVPCKNKPSQGYYTTTGWLNETCPYACPSGFPPMEVNPNCDDPWSYYFAKVGGVRGVGVLILLVAVSFGWLLSRQRVQTRRRLQWLQKQRNTGHRYVGMNDEEMLLFESLRGRHPLADLDVGNAEGTVGDFVSAVHSLRSRTVGESRPRWLLGYVVSCWRSLFRARKSVKKEAHLLHIGDLPYHTARIYLFGDNTPRDPWRLGQVPEELRQYIEERRWANFTAEVNRLCATRMRFQMVAEGVLRWIYLPVAEYIRWRLRFSRAAEVAAFVWSRSEDSTHEQTIWRLSLDNSSRFGLKFGTDREMTLAFVDVLDYCKALENWVIKPQLPMLIAAAGDGEYTAPYHLDYADPFVQSVAQYLGRRTWHQVLLPFNLLARLLPPNPTEEDVKPLRRSMQRVSNRALLQTDIECHAVLFEVLVPKTSFASNIRRRNAEVTPTRRQGSWEIQISHVDQPHDTFPGTGKAGWNSGSGTPTGSLTPAMQSGEHVLRRRLALVLTQRTKNSSRAWSSTSATALHERLSRVIPSPVGGLVYPTEFLNLAQYSPAICPSPIPDFQNFTDLPELDRQDTETAYHDFDSLLRQRSSGRLGNSALSAAFRDCGWSAESEPLSPQISTYSNLGPDPSPARSARMSLRLRRVHSARSALEMLLEWIGGSFMRVIQRLEASLHFVAAPGNHIYSWYLKRLRAIRAIGGVGRQTGLYLRHRKPRGSQESTLLCLIVIIAVAVLGFIAQFSILFSVQPRHGAFFAALLLPPFADILALVNTTLFVCGAADGTTACLFVVASNLNSLIGLLCRLMAMERWRSSGLFHVLGEYLMVFVVKVLMCRWVNLMIAFGEAEPALLEPGGNDADHEWVRDHVLFRRPAASPPKETAGSASATVSARPPPLEEMYVEQNSRSWLVKGLDSSRTLSDRFEEAPERINPSDPTLRGSDSVSLSDGWTPLLHKVSGKPSFHIDKKDSDFP